VAYFAGEQRPNLEHHGGAMTKHAHLAVEEPTAIRTFDQARWTLPAASSRRLAVWPARWLGHTAVCG
jgi:hypothetical protein